jgi:PAS domain S-box-containing protein
MNEAGKMEWAGRLGISVRRYGTALLTVAIALVLSRIFLHFDLPQPFAAFALSAIAVTFWYAGTGPGILAAVLSAIVRDSYFEPGTAAQSRFLFGVVFLVFAFLMTRVAWARDELERRVADRTAALTRSNDNLRREIAERNQAEYLTGQFFECSPDAVDIVGRDYRYKRVNRIREQSCGKPAKTIVGMHVAELAGEEFFESKLRPFLDRCFEGESVRFEEWFDNALGHRFLAVSYSPLKSDSQRVEAALIISRDITDLTLASEALRQAQADLAHVSRITAMGELTASLAHEVNQPIAAAITCAGTCVRWLMREEPDLEEARDAAHAVVRNARRAADIISRIRTMSKKGDSKRQLVDINDVIREIVALLQNEARRYSIAIRTDLGSNLPRIIADPVQVQQVIMNLIMNSIDATKDAEGLREILLASHTAEDQYLLVSVSDTGVGITPQQMDRIFDAFFTTKSHGIGMGLRISRSIVESHGGRLWATRNSPHGACFHFTLPLYVTTGT